jgi:hypothetical protein
MYVDLREAPLVLRGSAVPHCRPPHPFGAELAVATFCFTWHLGPRPCQEHWVRRST